jgi:hypothetical protein
MRAEISQDLRLWGVCRWHWQRLRQCRRALKRLNRRGPMLGLLTRVGSPSNNGKAPAQSDGFQYDSTVERVSRVGHFHGVGAFCVCERKDGCQLMNASQPVTRAQSCRTRDEWTVRDGVESGHVYRPTCCRARRKRRPRQKAAGVIILRFKCPIVEPALSWHRRRRKQHARMTSATKEMDPNEGSGSEWFDVTVKNLDSR